MPSQDHIRLFIPGPVEVRPEVLQAQTAWMIGHRSSEFADLYTRLQPKLKQTFGTEAGRVFTYTSSGTGVWESASRNLVRDDQRILHLVCGAFSDRWAATSEMNGKQVDRIEVEWGCGISAKQLAEALKAQPYDAVAVVHNETSTGVMNPVQAYAEVMRDYPETRFLVDAVSSYVGVDIQFDAWGMDVCLASAQKALALPPGISFAAISDRALARAEQVKNRGYYFDMVEMELRHKKNNTPATPPISLMFAADRQLDDMLAEGLDVRYVRHKQMQEMTHQWAADNGFELFAEAGYESVTLTTLKNTRNINVKALNTFLRERGMMISDGYGKTKGEAMRIAHMGDCLPEHLEELFTAMNDFLAQEA